MGDGDDASKERLGCNASGDLPRLRCTVSFNVFSHPSFKLIRAIFHSEVA